MKNLILILLLAGFILNISTLINCKKFDSSSSSSSSSSYEDSASNQWSSKNERDPIQILNSLENRGKIKLIRTIRGKR